MNPEPHGFTQWDEELKFCDCDASQMPGRSVPKLIERLPRSCEYLEIDTAGTEVGCLCRALQRAFSHLHRVRICVPSLCYRLFVAPDNEQRPQQREQGNKPPPLVKFTP
jgi:hypothetical protein